MAVTPYADSGDVVTASLYDTATSLMGHYPYGWGRYFYDTSTTGSGWPFYNPLQESTFFNSKNLRLLPITSIHYQGPHVTQANYSLGYDDAQTNLKAVLSSFGNDAQAFPVVNGEYYTSFALDSEDDSGPVTVAVEYLHGWVDGMHAGVADPNGHVLKGWAGVYNSQGNCGTWITIADMHSEYGYGPDFIYIACWLNSTAFPPWDEDNCTNTDAPPCNQPIPNTTTLWQYYAGYHVGSSQIDLDEGNPNIDFHAALGQYCPIPPIIT